MTSTAQNTRTQTTGLATWQIDPVHSEVGFAARHMMISTVRGRFTGVQGTVTFDPTDVAAGKVEVEIDAASVSTGNAQRDNHLRSADFFAADEHPALTFVSRSVKQTGNDEYRVTGDLTIRGVTKPVTLDTSFYGVHPDAYGGTRAGFSATGSVNRREFGLDWNQAIEAGGVVVGDTIKLTLEIQLVKQG